MACGCLDWDSWDLGMGRIGGDGSVADGTFGRLGRYSVMTQKLVVQAELGNYIFT